MLTQETLHRVMRYDAETGRLYWRERTADLMPDLRNRASWNAKNAGREALRNINSNGYKIGTVFGQPILAHRAVWILEHDNCEGEIDHISGDKLDNRLSNLRLVDTLTNQHNKPMPSKNTSGVVGVSFHKGMGRWAAKIGSRDRAAWLGTFDSFDDAVAARRAAEVERGYHPNHGRQTECAQATADYMGAG